MPYTTARQAADGMAGFTYILPGGTATLSPSARNDSARGSKRLMANAGVWLAEEDARGIRAKQSTAKQHGSREVRDCTHAALMRRVARTETSPEKKQSR